MFRQTQTNIQGSTLEHRDLFSLSGYLNKLILALSEINLIWIVLWAQCRMAVGWLTRSQRAFSGESEVLMSTERLRCKLTTESNVRITFRLWKKSRKCDQGRCHIKEKKPYLWVFLWEFKIIFSLKRCDYIVEPCALLVLR